jgi:hypothetical protein
MAFPRVLSDSHSASTNSLLSLHSSLSANHSQIGTYLLSELNRTDFLTKFPAYVSNLIQFLGFSSTLSHQYGRSAGVHNISREVVILCASMLDFPEFDIVDAEVRNRLIIAALTHGIPEKPSQLKIIAQKLIEKPGLLETLVASPDGAKVINQLFEVHFVRNVTGICHQWASRLVGLIAVCSGSPRCHGISYQVQKWRALQEVIAAMEEILRSTPRVLQQNRSYSHRGVVLTKKDDRHLQPFGSQKQQESDYRARATKPVAASSPPPLPDSIINLLDELEMKRPESLRAVEVLLDQIREQKTPDVLRSVLETFPCRPCHEISRNHTALQERKQRKESVNLGTFTRQLAPEETMFGSKLGLWKMLLSAEALKDIQRETQRGINHFPQSPSLLCFGG